MDRTALTRRHWLIAGTAAAGVTAIPAVAAARAPLPYGATPSPRQLAWQGLETYAFVHFTVNTFTDREWGLGDEDPAIFAPSDFSADQIVTAAKAGGLKQLIITAKHHDGFCLWQTAYTDHCIKHSPYKDGKGDIVGELAAACRAHGLKFGVYLSPWDRNNPDYGHPAYVTTYHNQLRELLSNYGPIHEVWFDGANGGDGYYGGAREVRKIDAATYYQWDKIRAIVRELQPQAVMFADEHMDVRWVGNEDGVAGDPCWPTMDYAPFTMPRGNAGVRGGPIWNPAEVDVSIRPGWFWHPDEDDKVRSPANLLRLYFESTGRGANLLLNLPPDRRGRIHENDAKSLAGFKAILDKAHAVNLNAGARVTASSTFGRGCAPVNVLSNKADFWAARENDTAGAWLQLDLPQARTFDMIRLAEATDYGVRVDDYAIDIWQDGAWKAIAEHTCISSQRLIRLDTPVTTPKVRLRVTKAAASPVLTEFSLYRLPDVVEEPAIVRDGGGTVTLRPPVEGLDIYYTTDGSLPSATSTPYTTPFPLPDGGTVRAIAKSRASDGVSDVSSRDFDVAPARWKAASNGAAADGLLNGEGFQGAEGQPVELVIDLAQPYALKGFTLTPYASRTLAITAADKLGAPAGFTAWVSADGQAWGDPVATGEFSNIAANRSEQKVRFDAPHTGRYLRLHLPRAVQDKPVIAVGGVGIITR